MTEFITRNHGHSCFEIIIKTTNPEHYKATQDFARRLIDHAKPMTNGDSIRAMSDEELMKFIQVPFCDRRKNDECKISYGGNCHLCIWDWLQQPVEES